MNAKQNLFTGTSEKGDFTEAINGAIAEAKKELKADGINWKLKEIGGESPGMGLPDVLIVIIEAVIVEGYELG
jgi:hypothetical protein